MPATRLLLTTLALLVSTALAPALAAAAPAVNGEFRVSAMPVYLAQGSDGSIWVTLSGGANDVAKIPPGITDDRQVEEFDLPDVISPTGIVAGPDGNLWVTQTNGVASFSPADPVSSERPFPIVGLTGRGIVVGPDRNLWTASSDQAFKITTAGVATPFRVTDMAANDIASGGDGLLYIADAAPAARDPGRIVGLTTDGRATFYTTGGSPQGVAAGPGTQIGFTNPLHAPEQIGRIAPGSPTPLTTDRPNIDPTGIVLGDDGAYWITNFGGDGNLLSRYTTDGQLTDLTGLSRGAGPRRIARGPNHTLWVSLQNTNRVARVTGVDPPPVTPPGGGGGGGGGTTPPGGGGTTTPPTADRTPPLVSKLFLPKRLHPGQRASIDVTLSEAATLSLRFTRVLPGKRTRAGRCVRPARSLRRRPACTRVVAVGTLTRTAGAGAVTLSWDGKVAGRKLAVGSYRLAIDAVDAAGNRSRSPAQTGFKVVRPARHGRPRARARR